MIVPLLALLLTAELPQGPCPASAKSFTGARHDAPFFVFDGGSAGPGFGQFQEPTAIAEIGGGQLAIADTGNNRIKIVTFEGFFQDFWGKAGGGPGEWTAPGALVAGEDGQVFVIDAGRHRIQVVQALQPLVADINGEPLRTFGSRGKGKGQFENPTGIALDARGRVLVADAALRRIQVFSPKGKLVDTYEDPAWVEPYGLAVDAASGKIFLSDRGAHHIFVLDPRGRPLAAWGERGSGPNQLDKPHGLTVHGGFLYVADTGNQRIVKSDLEGRFVAAVGCVGNEVGAFEEPVGVMVDSDHHLYVVDRGLNRVQKLGHQ